MNHYMIRVNNLLELNQQVKDEDRIKALVPIEKFSDKVFKLASSVICDEKKSNKKPGKTLVIGYINRYQQENLGCLNKLGNHYNQLAYQMKCNVCGFKYEANGCDIAIRKCPKCM